METTSLPAINQSGIPLVFSKNFSTSKYELFEVDAEFLDRITKTKEPLAIK